MTIVTSIFVLVGQVCVLMCAWMLYRVSDRLLQVFSEMRALLEMAKKR